MAKKTKKAYAGDPGDEHVEKVTPVMENPKPKNKKNFNLENDWVVKDRMYYLTGNKSPLSYLIRGSAIYYWDEDLGYERELKYTSNQKTVFVDEMKGEQRLEHIIFKNGSLFAVSYTHLTLPTILRV